MLDFDFWRKAMALNTNSVWVFPSVLKFLVYLALLHFARKLHNEQLRKIVFLAINLVAIILVYLVFKIEIAYLAYYLGIVLGFYALTRYLTYNRHLWLIPILTPITALVAVRYFFPSAEMFIGLSYMVFRLSQLVVIVRNKITPMPSLLDYLSFSFFLPTMIMGPINSYSTFLTSSLEADKLKLPANTCFTRMFVGATKLLFFASILDRVTYKGLLLDQHAHSPIDLVVAAVAYYLYLYFSFSGFCDIMIGAAGLVGIKVSENFDMPLAARNLKDFWNRWHITLSSYMRDMVFTPVSTALVLRVPKSMSTHAIAVTILMVFILIGIWHGSEMRFALFGLLHGVGVTANLYYSIFLKTHLSPEQRKWYHQNRIIKCICIAMTFSYICFTLFFFANTPAQVETIFAHLKH